MSEALLALDQPPLTVDQFAENPPGLREYLEERGALDFVPYQSGLFPASVLPPELAVTNMGMAWRRDNSHIINALFEAGQHDLAIPAARAQLTSLNEERDVLDGVVDESRNPNQPGGRLSVRVNGKTGARDSEFRVQNDSVGYPLWITGKLIEHDAIRPTRDDLETMAQAARYLGKIAYWQDRDAGHWEEEASVNAPSIGTVVAGLEQTRRAMNHVGYHHGIAFDELLTRGRNVLDAMIEQGLANVPSIPEWARNKMPADPAKTHSSEDFLRTFTGRFRRHDASMLFLVEPLNVLPPDQAAKVMNNAQTHLVRKHGTIRYPGDTYWSARFTERMRADEWATQAEGRLEWRNRLMGGVALSQTEAQWTLFESPQSTYHGKRYLETGGATDHSKQLLFLNRALSQLVPHQGKLLLPEAFYLDRPPVPCGSPTNRWIPNAHMPLLWAQANLLLALKTFEKTGV